MVIAGIVLAIVLRYLSRPARSQTQKYLAITPWGKIRRKRRPRRRKRDASEEGDPG
jgi:hypothetical protein